MQSKVIFGTSVIILQLLLFSKSHGFLNDICSIDSSLEKYCEGKYPVQNIYHPTDYHLNTATNNNTVQLHVDVRKERQLKTPQAKDGRAAINAEFMAGTTARPWLTKMDPPKSRNFERTDRRVVNLRRSIRTLNFRDARQTNTLTNRNLNVRSQDQERNSRFNSRTIRLHEQTSDNRRINSQERQNRHVPDQERVTRSNSRLDIRRIVQYNERSLASRRSAVTRNFQNQQVRTGTEQERVTSPAFRLTRIIQFQERTSESRRSVPTQERRQIREASDKERILSSDSRRNTRQIFLMNERSTERNSFERNQLRTSGNQRITDLTNDRLVRESRLKRTVNEHSTSDRNKFRAYTNQENRRSNDQFDQESRLSQNTNERISSEANQLRTSANQERRNTNRKSNDIRSIRNILNSDRRNILERSSSDRDARITEPISRRLNERSVNTRRISERVIQADRVRNAVRDSRIIDQSTERNSRTTERSDQPPRSDRRSMNTERRQIQNRMPVEIQSRRNSDRDSRSLERTEERQQHQNTRKSIAIPERRHTVERQSRQNTERDTKTSERSLDRLSVQRQQTQGNRNSMDQVQRQTRRSVERQNEERNSRTTERTIFGDRRQTLVRLSGDRNRDSQDRRNIARNTRITDRSLDRVGRQISVRLSEDRAIRDNQITNRRNNEKYINKKDSRFNANKEIEDRTLIQSKRQSDDSIERRQTGERVSIDSRVTTDRRTNARTVINSRRVPISERLTDRILDDRQIRRSSDRDSRIRLVRNTRSAEQSTRNERLTTDRDSRMTATEQRIIPLERSSITRTIPNTRRVINNDRFANERISPERDITDTSTDRESRFRTPEQRIVSLDRDTRTRSFRNIRSLERMTNNNRLVDERLSSDRDSRNTRTDRESKTRTTEQRIVSLDRDTRTRSFRNIRSLARMTNNNRLVDERLSSDRDSRNTRTDRESRTRTTEQRIVSLDRDSRTRSFRNIRSLERMTNNNRLVDERLSSDRDSRDTRTDRESRTRTTEQRIVSLDRDTRARSFRNIRSLERTTINNRFVDERLSSDRDSRDTRTDRESTTRTTEQRIVSLDRDTRTRSFRNIRSLERTTNNNRLVDERLSSDRDSRDTRTDPESRTRTTEPRIISLERDTRTRSVRNARSVERADNARDSRTADRTFRIRNKIVDSRRMLHNSDRTLDSRIQIQGRTALNRNIREATSPNRRVNDRIVDSNERSIGQLDRYLATRERSPNSRIHLASRNLQRRVRDFSERVLNERLRNVERDSTRTDSQIRELRVGNRNLENTQINKKANDRRNIREVYQRSFSDSIRNVEEREFLILTRPIHKIQDLDVGIEDTLTLQAIKIILIGLLLMQITRNKPKDIKIFRSFRMPIFAMLKQKVQ